MVSISYIHGKEKSVTGDFEELGDESETQISTSYPKYEFISFHFILTEDRYDA